MVQELFYEFANAKTDAPFKSRGSTRGIPEGKDVCHCRSKFENLVKRIREKRTTKEYEILTKQIVRYARNL